MQKYIIVASVAFLFAHLCFGSPVSSSKTPCQEHRERELKKTGVQTAIPECDEKGDYKPKACFSDASGGKRFCVCYTKSGDIVHQPSTKIEACECHVEKHEKAKTGAIGAFIPQCEPSGKYAKKQCHGSTGYCWCADESGKNTTAQVRGVLNCA